MTKICHILQSAGGVETYIINICNSNNFDHCVITYTNGSLAETARDAGASVVMIPMNRKISMIRDVMTIFNITKYLKKYRPSIIHAHSGKGGIYGRICGRILNIPVIFTPHSFSYQNQEE